MLNKKQREIIQNMTFKKYKLGFFGSSPKEDWIIILIMFFVLILGLSVLAFFDKQKIEREISSVDLQSIENKYFDFSKAEELIKNMKGESMIDQTLEN